VTLSIFSILSTKRKSCGGHETGGIDGAAAVLLLKAEGENEICEIHKSG